MMDGVLLQMEIILPAMLAGMLILSTHVPLGREVLQRGIIFLDLAIAQMAALGLVFSHAIGLEGQSPFLDQLIAIGAAVIGASLLYVVRHVPVRTQEALIGILFMLAATGSILLLAHDPHGGERLRELLVGQILWVEYGDLIATGLIYAVLLLLWFGWRAKLGSYGFYPIFAITITLSTQLIGVYLVFASLIIPALVTLSMSRPWVSAYAIGFAGYLLGLLFSALLDLPSGAMVAWALAGIALLVVGLRRVKAKRPDQISGSG